MERDPVTSLLKTVAGILSKLKIPYFLTGGIAVMKWGRPRSTLDIDMVARLVPKNLDELARELLKIDKYAYVDRQAMYNALQIKGEFNFIHGTSGVKVDFWVLKNDDFSRQQMTRRIADKIENQTVYFSTPEDLILNKLNWFKESQSSRHLEDVESILARQKELDIDYLKKQAAAQSTSGILESLLKQKK